MSKDSPFLSHYVQHVGFSKAAKYLGVPKIKLIHFLRNGIGFNKNQAIRVKNKMTELREIDKLPFVIPQKLEAELRKLIKADGEVHAGYVVATLSHKLGLQVGQPHT